MSHRLWSFRVPVDFLSQGINTLRLPYKKANRWGKYLIRPDFWNPFTAPGGHLRAAIFIDGGYLLPRMKHARVNPEWFRLTDHFMAPIRSQISLDLLRCYFYYCAPWMSPAPTEEEQRRMETHDIFVDQIESQSRWQVRLGKLEKRWDGTKEYFEQKRVDVMLSVDLTLHAAAGHIQHAIIVAGDSDFIPAIEAAKQSGVTISLWYVKGNVHRDLLTMADEIHEIDFRKFPARREHPVAQPKGTTTKTTAPVIGEKTPTESPATQPAGPRRRGRRGGVGRGKPPAPSGA